MDRCVMRSLCHLDARDDPLPADCPVLGAYASRPPRPAMSEDELQKAETGGSKGMLAARRPVFGLGIHLRASSPASFSPPYSWWAACCCVSCSIAFCFQPMLRSEGSRGGGFRRQ